MKIEDTLPDEQPEEPTEEERLAEIRRAHMLAELDEITRHNQAMLLIHKAAQDQMQEREKKAGHPEENNGS